MNNRCATGCLGGLAVIAYIVLIAGLTFGSSELIDRIVLGPIICLSFVALLHSLLRNVTSKRVENPLRHFIHAQGILAAIVVEFTAGYLFFVPVSSFSSGGFFAALATFLFTVFLIIHVQSGPHSCTSTNTRSSLLLTSLFIVSFWYVFNSSVDILGVIVFVSIQLIIIVQIISCTVKFSSTSNPYLFCLALFILTSFVFIVLSWAGNAYIAGF